MFNKQTGDVATPGGEDASTSNALQLTAVSERQEHYDEQTDHIDGRAELLEEDDGTGDRVEAPQPALRRRKVHNIISIKELIDSY